MDRSLLRRRIVLVGATSVIAVAMAGGLWVAVRLGANQGLAPTPTAFVTVLQPTNTPAAFAAAPVTVTSSASITPTTSPAASSSPVTAQSTLTPAIQPDRWASPVATTTLAIVNGVIIDAALFELAQGIDDVMAQLLGAEPAPPSQLLDQIVNGELVWQALQAAGTIPSDGAAILAELLSAKGIAMGAMDTLLAKAGIERDRFDAYFARLVAVDAFAQAAAAELGVPADEYVRQLQRSARISFGPAANQRLVSPTPPAAAKVDTAEPAPTLDALAEVTATPVQPLVVTPVPTTTMAEDRGNEIGQLAPEFGLPLLASPGRQLVLADLAGRPAVVSFWTTWCPYCLRQTPVMVAAHMAVSDSVFFAGVNVQESEDVVRPYVAEHAIAYPVLLDSNGAISSAYGVLGFPMTYFLDSTGHIVAKHAGQLSPDQLNEYLRQLGFSS